MAAFHSILSIENLESLFFLANENMNKLANTHLVLKLILAPFGSSSLVIAGALYETMANENRLILAEHITSKMEINLQERIISPDKLAQNTLVS
jgi:hypothetical protein